MYADMTIEGGSCEEIGIAGTPSGLKRPIVACWELSDDFARLGIPAEGAVVFAARKQQICVLTAPRDGEDTFVMSREDLRFSKTHTN